MTEMMRKWFKRHFSDPEALSFLIVMGIITIIIVMFGKLFAPVLAAIVIAYLLESPVAQLTRIKCPRILAVWGVFIVFLGILLYGILGLLPLLWQQMVTLFEELPNMLSRGQELIVKLPERYPDFFSVEQISHFTQMLKSQVVKISQVAVSQTLSTIPSLIAIVVYFVLVPMLVLFFLIDKRMILSWVSQFMPARKTLLTNVWREVHEQIGNYIRGKVVEIVIVWVVFYVFFLIMELPYAMLLSALVGVSVLIPYIGAIAVTLPVMIIAFWSWGWGTPLAYFIVIYGVLITLDGYVLAPLLVSEAVNLHPIAVIIAILFFGGLFGFWGVFFSIPLASLVKAIMHAWPSLGFEAKRAQSRRKPSAQT